jgi:hypothetical protein
LQTEAGWYVNNSEATGLVGMILNTGSFCRVGTQLEEAFEVPGTPIAGIPKPSAIPEPSALAMTAGGLLLMAIGLVARRRSWMSRSDSDWDLQAAPARSRCAASA